MLTGCGSKPIHHHGSHPKTTAVKKVHHHHMSHKAAKPKTKKSKKSTKVNKKDIDKSGMSTSDIKKDSRAVHKKKSYQPVD